MQESCFFLHTLCKILVLAVACKNLANNFSLGGMISQNSVCLLVPYITSSNINPKKSRYDVIQAPDAILISGWGSNVGAGSIYLSNYILSMQLVNL